MSKNGLRRQMWGAVVNNFLTKHFSNYVDYDFTARLEDELDAVSRGEKEWLPLMKNFWETFEKQIREKEETVSRSEAIQARELGIDPKSGSPVSVRIGRYGPFAQIGTKEDEDKPKFAGLLPGQKLGRYLLWRKPWHFSSCQGRWVKQKRVKK